MNRNGTATGTGSPLGHANSFAFKERLGHKKVHMALLGNKRLKFITEI